MRRLLRIEKYKEQYRHKGVADVKPNQEIKYSTSSF